MSRLDTIQDLQKIHALFQKEVETRAKASTTIFVGMGTCGLSAGAGGVMRAVQDELAAREIEARVASVGCIGMCSKEPLLDIQQGDGPRITYGNVTPKMASRNSETRICNVKLSNDIVNAPLFKLTYADLLSVFVD